MMGEAASTEVLSWKFLKWALLQRFVHHLPLNPEGLPAAGSLMWDMHRGALKHKVLFIS